MGKVVKAIIVTKPEDLSKVELGQTSIILKPNLNIKDINKGDKIEKKWTWKVCPKITRCTWH